MVIPIPKLVGIFLTKIRASAWIPTISRIWNGKDISILPTSLAMQTLSRLPRRAWLLTRLLARLLTSSSMLELSIYVRITFTLVNITLYPKNVYLKFVDDFASYLSYLSCLISYISIYRTATAIAGLNTIISKSNLTFNKWKYFVTTAIFRIEWKWNVPSFKVYRASRKKEKNGNQKRYVRIYTWLIVATFYVLQNYCHIFLPIEPI